MIRPQVRLKPDSPYHYLFPDGWVPVQSPIAVTMNLEGVPAERCWMLDPLRCSDEQLRRIAELVAKIFNDDPADVLVELQRVGLPIRECRVDVPAAIDLRFIL